MRNTSSDRSDFIGKILITILVVGCIIAAWKLPLWSMKLVAPMYPKGLMMVAYGDKLEGDLYELNIVNHYVGMKHITVDEFSLMSLFPVGLIGIVLLGIIPIFLPKLRKWCAWLAVIFPIGILICIQYYLYAFGHGLNPEAPIKIPEFMPIAIGNSSIVNFTASSMIGWGMAALFVAAALIGFGPRLLSGKKRVRSVKKIKQNFPRPSATATAAVLICLCTSAFGNQSLQELINKAKPHDTLRVPSGEYAGPITIAKPIVLQGIGQPLIQGSRKGDVVTITSDSVTLDGFTIQFSGSEVTEDAAGVKAQGKHITIIHNTIRNVYFGIHILQSDNVLIWKNTITPSQDYADRPGHGVNVWNVKNIWVTSNIIDDARDGVLLTYVENANVTDNTITRCRYGLHSMYSAKIDFSNNTVRDNLLGIALMYSKVLTARKNTILDHRRGTSPFGFLLKDIDNATIEGNYIQANQIGIFAEGLSMAYGSHSVIRSNTILGNQCGVSVQSSAKFLFYGNDLIENLVDVQKQTDHINRETRWSSGDSGNYWGPYHGYDNDANGIGDVPYQIVEIPELKFDRNTPSRAFIYSPAYLVLESAVRMFPSFQSEPILEDSMPSLTPVAAAIHRTHSGEHQFSIFSVISLAIFIGGIAGVKFFHPFSKRGQ
jgi:nitrous oxidase accessory protein